MGDLLRMRVVLDYTNGGPGLNTFFFNAGAVPILPIDVDDIAANVRTFYESFKAYLAQGNTIRVPKLVETIDSSTGIVDGAIAGTGAELTTTAGDASSTSRATQIYLSLKTGVVRRRRLMRGGLFVGPLGDAAIQTNGSVLPLAITTLKTAAGALRSAQFTQGQEWVVYGRPVLNNSGGVVETGLMGAVQGFAVKSNPGVLRSRRD